MTIGASDNAFISSSGEGQVLKGIGRLKVGLAHNGGSFELIELTGAGGPQPHVHQDHDECFYIIEGTFTFILGTEEVQAQTDSVVFVPRGTRHAFMAGDKSRAFVFVVPAHLEGFFHELGEGLAAGRPEAELRAELAGKYDSWPAK